MKTVSVISVTFMMTWKGLLLLMTGRKYLLRLKSKRVNITALSVSLADLIHLFFWTGLLNGGLIHLLFILIMDGIRLKPIQILKTLSVIQGLTLSGITSTRLNMIRSVCHSCWPVFLMPIFLMIW